MLHAMSYRLLLFSGSESHITLFVILNLFMRAFISCSMLFNLVFISKIIYGTKHVITQFKWPNSLGYIYSISALGIESIAVVAEITLLVFVATIRPLRDQKNRINMIRTIWTKSITIIFIFPNLTPPSSPFHIHISVIQNASFIGKFGL